MQNSGSATTHALQSKPNAEEGSTSDGTTPNVFWNKDTNSSENSNIIVPTYIGLFVQDKAALEEKYPSDLPNKYYDHMTSAFKPGEVDASTLGEESELHVIGRLTTEKVDACHPRTFSL